MGEEPMSAMRMPEERVQVFVLGHYEQMIVAKALAWATTGDPDFKPTPDETANLRGLEYIFAHHCRVTVLREVDPES